MIKHHIKLSHSYFKKISNFIDNLNIIRLIPYSCSCNQTILYEFHLSTISLPFKLKPYPVGTTSQTKDLFGDCP